MAKTAVVVDAACDLPANLTRQRDIHILPNRLILGDQVLTDARDANLTLAFHQRYASARDLKVSVEHCSAEVITTLIQKRLVTEYDRAILMTLSQEQSRLFQSATEASFNVLRTYREYRRKAGINTPFYLSVLDSKVLFAGQGLLAYEVTRMLQDPDLALNDLRRLTEELRQAIQCYILPDDLFYARRHSQKWVEQATGFMGFRSLLGIRPVLRYFDGEVELAFKARGFDQALAGLLDLARQAVDHGTLSPAIVVSYAGDLQVLRQKPIFAEFEHYSRQLGVDVLVSVMSATAGVYVGPGALSLAFATT